MSQATYNQIVTELQKKLLLVPDIGIVHPYRRDIRSKDELIASFLDRKNNIINGLMIWRQDFPDHKQGTQYQNVKISTYKIRPFYQHSDKDGSEISFQALIDGITAAFRPQDTLGGLVELIYPLKAIAINYIMFGKPDTGILCHTADLSLDIQEFYIP